MVRTTIATALFAANLALAAPAPAQAVDASPAPAIPVLRPAVTVTSDIVRIGDLVSNAGIVADIAIFRAPDPGETGSVPSARVLDAVRAHHLIGVNTQNINEVTVTRAGRAISPKDIEAQIARFFAGQFGLGKPQNIAVLFDRELRTVHVEPTAGELRIARANYDQRSTRFDVVFEPPGGAGRPPLHVTGRLFEAVQVAILTRPLARGDIIKPTDITLERKPKAELTDSGPAEGAIGLAARQPLQAGQVIRRADVMKPQLIRANDTVTIVYEVPGVVLTMRGKAIDSGGQDDLVSVLNIQSKRVIQGSVSGPGRITIAATPGPLAVTGTIAQATPPLPTPTATTSTAAADLAQPAASPRRTE